MAIRLSATAFLIGCLAVWRITHLLWGEDGPGDIFVRLRKLAGESLFGRLLDCFYCLSLWIALPFAWALGVSWPERALLWLAFSGGAILLERATARHFPHSSSQSADAPPSAIWQETPREDSTNSPQEEHSNVLLR
jgi:hypothetical protein